MCGFPGGIGPCLAPASVLPALQGKGGRDRRGSERALGQLPGLTGPLARFTLHQPVPKSSRSPPPSATLTDARDMVASGSAQSDFDYWDYATPEPNLQQAVLEEPACWSLAATLEQCLSRSKQSKLGCSTVLVPERLTRRIAQDVLRLSSTEPCGLRSCVIQVQLEAGDVCKRLGRIVWDTSVAPTFELTLVFKQEPGSWGGFRNMFSRGCLSAGLGRTLILSPGFRLVKKKLYSLLGPIVTDGC